MYNTIVAYGKKKNNSSPFSLGVSENSKYVQGPTPKSTTHYFSFYLGYAFTGVRVHCFTNFPSFKYAIRIDHFQHL